MKPLLFVAIMATQISIALSASSSHSLTPANSICNSIPVASSDDTDTNVRTGPGVQYPAIGQIPSNFNPGIFFAEAEGEGIDTEGVVQELNMVGSRVNSHWVMVEYKNINDNEGRSEMIKGWVSGKKLIVYAYGGALTRDRPSDTKAEIRIDGGDVAYTVKGCVGDLVKIRSFVQEAGRKKNLWLDKASVCPTDACN